MANPVPRFCEIYSICQRRSFVWKWRHRDARGALTECAESHTLYFECVAAARASGYEPRPAWTAPVTLALKPTILPPAL